MLGRSSAEDDEGRVYWGRKQALIPSSVGYDSTLLATNTGVVAIRGDAVQAVGDAGVAVKALGGFLFVAGESILPRRHVLACRNDDIPDVTSATRRWWRTGSASQLFFTGA